jgi:ABC-type branched-subunit amino acid transport system substrate-binding protein
VPDGAPSYYSIARSGKIKRWESNVEDFPSKYAKDLPEVVVMGPHCRTTFDPARRAWLRLMAGGAAAALAGCNLTGSDPSQPVVRASPPDQAIGSGLVTVALLAPLSAGGGGGAAATAIRNACDMAMSEFVNGEFKLIVKDDLGTPAGATAATTAAIAEGARIVLGPLFAPSVSAAGAVARSGGIPMIAFSSDASVAAPGVYLLSFMPQSDVERIVSFASQSGKHSYAALIAQTAYGSVVQGEFQQSVARNGARIAVLEQYPLDRLAMQDPVARVAQVIRAGQADALFVPEGGDALPLIAQSLTVNAINPHDIQLLGTGVWEDRRVFAEPLLAGGLYAAPDAAGFQNFSARYRERFGSDPVRIASLGYDAVSLVTALVKTYGGRAFEAENITNPSGFTGMDGAFRFRHDGTSERSLAVLRVTSSGGETVAPALRSFTA